MDPVAVVVYGASGFTGRLVCAELSRRQVSFAVAGRVVVDVALDEAERVWETVIERGFSRRVA